MIVKLSLILTVITIACSGCATERGILFPDRQEPLLWPPPPLTPRIKYIGQISTEDDLKREVNAFESFGRLIFGREDIGVLSRPYGLFLHDDEKLYIADTSGSVVHMMNLKSRKYIQFCQISEHQSLKFPIGIIKVDDKIYVSDSLRSEICVFSESGKYLFSFGEDILERPSGLTYDDNLNRIYVADTKKHSVFVFDPEGSHVNTIGQRGGGKGTFNYPTQVWAKNKLLYVSDTLNYRIQIFDSEGNFIKAIGAHGNRPGYFAHPCGIATDSLGNIYVSDKQFENVQIFNSQGDILMSFGSEGAEPGQFWLPAAIYIDDKDRIFIADSFNKRIQIFKLLEGVSK